MPKMPPGIRFEATHKQQKVRQKTQRQQHKIRLSAKPLIYPHIKNTPYTRNKPPGHIIY